MLCGCWACAFFPSLRRTLCESASVGQSWSWGFVNRNGKCNCIRERSGLSGLRVWINANFSSFFFLLSSPFVVLSSPVPSCVVLFLFFFW